MAQLHHIKISHFRGLKQFEHTFGKGITCIIGRGDSGKSTILDAISFLFSQSWSIHLNDSDFFACDTNTPIVIEGTVVDLPQELIVKYGNHLRGIRKDGSLLDDMELPEAAQSETALTIRLTVGKDLEPLWFVVSYNGEEPSIIKATDRGKLNVFSISDYSDRHFSLNKGNPLYSLYKQFNGDTILDDENKVLDVVREAKKAFDSSINDKFDAVINRIKEVASSLGIALNEMKAMLDHKDIAISENKVSIHEDGVPFRLKGKGSKRLLSLAIQLSLTQPSGVILVDEIEQGLEPDRAQHLVNTLSKYSGKQVIITTHSSNVITEIPCESLFLMRRGNHTLLHVEGELQGSIRKNPEAFFARKVLICEGATEIGICRAINQWRIASGKDSVACLGIRFADGAGNSMKHYVSGFHSLGYPTALFCDSDKEGKEINDLKPHFKKKGICVIDCEEGYNIEGQIFKDVSWPVAKGLVSIYLANRVAERKSATIEQASKEVFDNVNTKLFPKRQWSESWYDKEDLELRKVIGLLAGDNKWFKRINYGEQVGECILQHYDGLDAECRLKAEIDKISNWIDS